LNFVVRAPSFFYVSFFFASPCRADDFVVNDRIKRHHKSIIVMILMMSTTDGSAACKALHWWVFYVAVT